MTLVDRALVMPQYLAPQHALSRLVRWTTRQPWSRHLIPFFCRQFGVNLAEAVVPESGFPCFNEFFTRRLRDGERPIASGPDHVTCPADGAISQLGELTNGMLLQAKGHLFSLAALLGDEASARALATGRFATIYLSPRDYHRVHAPFDFRVESAFFIPGQLFSVNDRTARAVPNLYARNERVVLMGQSPWGPCAYVMVGAMLVSSMSLEGFALEAMADSARTPIRLTPARPIEFAQGDEVGRFNMGSTVILVLPAAAPGWTDTTTPGTAVRMGQLLASR